MLLAPININIKENLMQTNSMKVALFGAGYWGKNYFRLLEGIPETSIAAVIDPNFSMAVMNTRSDIPYFYSIEHFMQDMPQDDWDAAIVCTPSNTHMRHCEILGETGKPILCEKPLVVPGQDIQYLLNRSKGLIFPGLNYLHHPGVECLRNAINRQSETCEIEDLGKLMYARFSRTNLGPFRLDTDASYDLSIHDLSIAIKTIGIDRTSQIMNVQRTFSVQAPDQEQSGTVNFNLEFVKDDHRIPVNFFSSWNEAGKRRLAKFVFERGTILFDEMKSWPVSVITNHDQAERSIVYGNSNEEPLRKQLEKFISAAKSGAKLCEEMSVYRLCDYILKMQFPERFRVFP